MDFHHQTLFPYPLIAADIKLGLLFSISAVTINIVLTGSDSLN